MFSLTSGTTAQAKYIPITERFLADYRSGWQAWGIQAIDAHPGINSRNILQLSSDYDLFRTPGGTPCGNISGLVAACQKRIVRTMYTVPGVVAKIRDSDAKLYTAMRLAVADRNIGMVMTANPSTLIQLAKLADSRKDDLIRDIADGTLVGRRKRPRAKSARLSAANLAERHGTRRRARIDRRADRPSPAPRFLARDAAFGDLDGRKRLRVSAGPSRRLRPNPDPRPRAIGQRRPHDDSGFRRHSGRNPRRDDPFLRIHSRERIRTSGPDSCSKRMSSRRERTTTSCLTTSSGLCRYNICDVVRCTGFYHSTPLVEFLHKGAHIANLTGEKISESQVVAAVRAASDEMRLCLSQFTVSPVWGNPPKYHLHIERADLPAPHLGESLADRVDDHLKVDQLRIPRQAGLRPPGADRMGPPAGRNMVDLRPAPPAKVGGKPRTVQAPLPRSRPGIQLETAAGTGRALAGPRTRQHPGHPADGRARPCRNENPPTAPPANREIKFVGDGEA